MSGNSNNESFTLLLELNLQSIPSDVVERFWKGEQLETDQDYVESVTGAISAKFMRTLHKSFQKLIKSSNDFWTYISERQLSHKTLIVWLYNLIEKRTELSFLAGNCYISLLELPGNSGFPIYHPFAFRGTLNLLKSWKDAKMKEFIIESSKEKLAKRTKRKNEPSKKKTRAKKPKKSNKRGAEEDREDMEEDEDINEEEKHSEEEEGVEDRMEESTEETSILSVSYDTYLTFLQNLKAFFKHSGLDKYCSEYSDIVDVILDLTRFPYATIFPKMEEGSHICYSILNTILTSNKSEYVVTMYTTVFKGLISNLLMNFSQSGTTVPKYLTSVRKEAVEFVCEMIETEDSVCIENVHILLQQLTTRVPEKADYRSYTCDSVLEILIPMSLLERMRFLKFLQRLSKNVKPSSRLLAVELSSHLLSNVDKLVTQKDSDIEGALTAPLLEILIKRSSDKVGTVRAKSLGCLSTIFELVETNDILRKEIRSSFQTDNRNSEGLFRIDKLELLSLLRKRIVDDKSGVRKSSLQVYQIFGCLEENLIQETDVCLIVERCLDSAVSIRKEAMNCICTLVGKYPEDKSICIAWCHAVLPLVMDPESTVQNKCLDYFDSIIFRDLLANKENAMCWNILQYIQSESYRYVEKLFLLLSREKKLTKNVIKCIESCISIPQLSKSCWLLLSFIAPYCFNYIDHEIVVEKWEDIKYSTKEELIQQQQQILSVLESISVNISTKVAKKLAEELFERLKRFDASCPLIQSMIRALVRLTSSDTSHLEEWSSELLSICDQQLSSYLLPQTSILQNTLFGTVSSDSIIRYLFTIGELSQINSCTIPSRTVTLIQALTSSTMSSDNSSSSFNISMNNSFNSSLSISSNSGIRAYAFITLGKLCLEDQQLAKKCIPALARELQTSDSPVVRNNIIVILCDLCIKYTAIVDKFIPTIALSLRDPNDTVRRQTLMLLSRLLQEDFLKWKTTLFYRFILALVDDNMDVQQSAKFCFVTLLKSKNPIMFFTHFMETVFYLNNSHSHAVYNQFPQSERERMLFSLSGVDNRRKRMEIYKLFLANMSDEQKFQIAAKLCQEILAPIVDGNLPYDSCSEVLYDSLVLLASKEIKLTAKSTNVAQSTEEEEQEEAINAAKDKLLSKKNVLENIVPIVIELKRYLEKRRSPMLKNVMEYLKEMLKDYKEEISDILVADKQLAKEIEYDMKQFANQQKKSQATVVATPDKLMSPRPAIFSPKTTTPKELANFSVPRLRGSTPKRPLMALSAASSLLSPAPSKKPLEEVNSNVDQPIVLSSPVNDSPSARKWGVSLVAATPLSFDEDDKDSENTEQVTKKKKTTQKKTKTKTTKSRKH